MDHYMYVAGCPVQPVVVREEREGRGGGQVSSVELVKRLFA